MRYEAQKAQFVPMPSIVSPASRNFHRDPLHQCAATLIFLESSAPIREIGGRTEKKSSFSLYGAL